MMILHGDNQVASRQAWVEAKKGKQVLELDGLVLTVDQLHTAVNTVSLFGQQNSLFIEGLFSRRPSNDRKAVITYLEQHTELDVTLWEGKEVATTLPNKNFESPKYIFGFLNKPSVDGLHQVIQTMPVEQVFASLVTRAHKQIKLDWLGDLLAIDYAQKTGTAAYDLVAALELWIVRAVR